MSGRKGYRRGFGQETGRLKPKSRVQPGPWYTAGGAKQTAPYTPSVEERPQPGWTNLRRGAEELPREWLERYPALADVMFGDPPPPEQRYPVDMCARIWPSSQPDEGLPDDAWDILVGDHSPAETRYLYNAFAEGYEEYMSSQSYMAPQVLGDYIYQNLQLPESTRFVDVGCGTGLLGSVLQRHGYQKIIGVDISEEMIRQARMTKTAYAKFIPSNVNPRSTLSRIPVGDCVVLCGSLLPGHITPSTLPLLAGQALQNEGFLVWIMPDQNHLGHQSPEFQPTSFQQALTELQRVGLRQLDELRDQSFIKDIPGVIYAFQKR